MKKNNSFLFLMSFLLVGILSGFNSSAQEWSCFRGPNFNGISAEKIQWPKNGPKEFWKTNVGVGHSAISVANGLAYTMGNVNDTDLVVCLDAKTGSEIWKYAYACEATYFAAKPYDGPGATPTVDRGVVYTFSRSGHALALDAKTGALIWKRNLEEEENCVRPQWGFSGSAFIDGEGVILNATTGGICLDRTTGKTIWKTVGVENTGDVAQVQMIKTGGDEGGYATPVPIMVDGKKYLVIFGTQTLSVVNPVDGSVFWSTERKQPIGLNAADPVVEGTSIFVSAGRRCGGARYDITKGTVPLWDNGNMNNHWQTCVFLDGFLYGCEGNNAAGAGRSPNSLRCLDWETGKIVWENTDLDFFGLIIADGKLVMLTDGGELILAEASSSGYKEFGRAKVIGEHGFTAPVLANGKVYVRNNLGDVVCVDMQN